MGVGQDRDTPTQAGHSDLDGAWCKAGQPPEGGGRLPRHDGAAGDVEHGGQTSLLEGLGGADYPYHSGAQTLPRAMADPPPDGVVPKAGGDGLGHGEKAVLFLQYFLHTFSVASTAAASA